MKKCRITKRTKKRFTDQCFDRESEQAARIIKGVLDAGSPRISDIANSMYGNYDANYKSIQRFIEDDKPNEALHRLYNEESEYVLGDPTDIERPQAVKTDYVGKLKNKKLGFTTTFLATPYRGRAIPFSFISYSSKTINSEMSSRNMKHIKSISELKELLGDKILVMDREFSYELLFEEMTESDIQYVIRLNIGTNPTIRDEEGNRISLTVGIGEEVHYEGVYYKGKVKVNLAGKWEKGFKEPLWVIGSLKPSELLRVYRLRAKIDESFRDMKNLLNLDKIMNNTYFISNETFSQLERKSDTPFVSQLSPNKLITRSADSQNGLNTHLQTQIRSPIILPIKMIPAKAVVHQEDDIHRY